MLRFIHIVLLIVSLLLISPVNAQNSEGSRSIDGTWITQGGNIVEVTTKGTDVSLYFPAFARTMKASWDGTTLTYITHYNSPREEAVYINVPDEDIEACRNFIRIGDERHKFTLSLSENGYVLSGTKEINVLQVTYDTDENGKRTNHKPAGYAWKFDSNYQWRRIDCDFENLPPLNGNINEKYKLVDEMITRFGLLTEFNINDLNLKKQIIFSYSQNYINTKTGEFVPLAESGKVAQKTELPGRVYFDESAESHVIELYPIAMNSYSQLLTALSILLYQLNAVQSSDVFLEIPTTRMQIDSVNYAWSHRQGLCALDDPDFSTRIDVLSRALEYKALNER